MASVPTTRGETAPGGASGDGWGAGLRVCTTGLSLEMRQMVAAQVEAAGGSYAPGLSRTCTHLLLGDRVATGDTPSDKLTHALRVAPRWPHLAVVRLAWWEASCRMRQPLPAAPFLYRLSAVTTKPPPIPSSRSQRGPKPSSPPHVGPTEPRAPLQVLNANAAGDSAQQMGVVDQQRPPRRAGVTPQQRHEQEVTELVHVLAAVRCRSETEGGAVVPRLPVEPTSAEASPASPSGDAHQLALRLAALRDRQPPSRHATSVEGIPSGAGRSGVTADTGHTIRDNAPLHGKQEGGIELSSLAAALRTLRASGTDSGPACRSDAGNQSGLVRNGGDDDGGENRLVEALKARRLNENRSCALAVSAGRSDNGCGDLAAAQRERNVSAQPLSAHSTSFSSHPINESQSTDIVAESSAASGGGRSPCESETQDSYGLQRHVSADDGGDGDEHVKGLAATLAQLRGRKPGSQCAAQCRPADTITTDVTSEDAATVNDGNKQAVVDESGAERSALQQDPFLSSAGDGEADRLAAALTELRDRKVNMLCSDAGEVAADVSRVAGGNGKQVDDSARGWRAPHCDAGVEEVNRLSAALAALKKRSIEAPSNGVKEATAAVVLEGSTGGGNRRSRVESSEQWIVPPSGGADGNGKHLAAALAALKERSTSAPAEDGDTVDRVTRAAAEVSIDGGSEAFSEQAAPQQWSTSPSEIADGEAARLAAALATLKERSVEGSGGVVHKAPFTAAESRLSAGRSWRVPGESAQETRALPYHAGDGEATRLAAALAVLKERNVGAPIGGVATSSANKFFEGNACGVDGSRQGGSALHQRLTSVPNREGEVTSLAAALAALNAQKDRAPLRNGDESTACVDRNSKFWGDVRGADGSVYWGPSVAVGEGAGKRSGLAAALAALKERKVSAMGDEGNRNRRGEPMVGQTSALGGKVGGKDCASLVSPQAELSQYTAIAQSPSQGTSSNSPPLPNVSGLVRETKETGKGGPSPSRPSQPEVEGGQGEAALCVVGDVSSLELMGEQKGDQMGQVKGSARGDYDGEIAEGGEGCVDEGMASVWQEEQEDGHVPVVMAGEVFCGTSSNRGSPPLDVSFSESVIREECAVGGDKRDSRVGVSTSSESADTRESYDRIEDTAVGEADTAVGAGGSGSDLAKALAALKQKQDGTAIGAVVISSGSSDSGAVVSALAAALAKPSQPAPPTPSLPVPGASSSAQDLPAVHPANGSATGTQDATIPTHKPLDNVNGQAEEMDDGLAHGIATIGEACGNGDEFIVKKEEQLCQGEGELVCEAFAAVGSGAVAGLSPVSCPRPTVGDADGASLRDSSPIGSVASAFSPTSFELPTPVALMSGEEEGAHSPLDLSLGLPSPAAKSTTPRSFQFQVGAGAAGVTTGDGCSEASTPKLRTVSRQHVKADEGLPLERQLVLEDAEELVFRTPTVNDLRRLEVLGARKESDINIRAEAEGDGFVHGTPLTSSSPSAGMGAGEVVPDTPGMDLTPLPGVYGSNRATPDSLQAQLPLTGGSSASDSSVGGGKLQRMGRRTASLSRQPVAKLEAEQGAALKRVRSPLAALGLEHGVEADGGGGGRALLSPAEADAKRRRGDLKTEPSSQGEGVFAGVVAVFEKAMAEDEVKPLREALLAGGGLEASGAFLGSGATHVVCPPASAGDWLSSGLHVVSPAWVLHSVRHGRVQRCVQLSLDVQRALEQHEPSATTAENAASVKSNGGATLPAGINPPSNPTGSGVDVDRDALRSSREAREALVNGVMVAEAAAWAGAAVTSVGGRRRRHVRTPTELIAGLDWVVTDDPASEGAVPSEGDIPLDEVVYSASSITVLLPQDRAGDLGHASRTFSAAAPPGTGGLSQMALMRHVHDFYSEELELEEQIAAMKGLGQAGGRAATLLRQAFLEMKPLRRVELLGSRCCCEGLFKISGDPMGTIYELQLTG